IQNQNKYLFTKRNDEGSVMHNKWQIAGGGLEFGEKPEETLYREVREELGTTVKVIYPEPFVDTEVWGKWQGVFISYLCELTHPSNAIILNEEATDFKWFTLEELPKVDLLPGCIALIEKVEKFTEFVLPNSAKTQ
ncbi:MAG TPA: NUDIX hydrolase, partial [Candidatus Woesebacteria bacterium]|nr:NUDIX hydrolase [Candidatus Woesebacteria bacterium]